MSFTSDGQLWPRDRKQLKRTVDAFMGYPCKLDVRDGALIIEYRIHLTPTRYFDMTFPVVARFTREYGKGPSWVLMDLVEAFRMCASHQAPDTVDAILKGSRVSSWISQHYVGYSKLGHNSYGKEEYAYVEKTGSGPTHYLVTDDGKMPGFVEAYEGSLWDEAEAKRLEDKDDEMLRLRRVLRAFLGHPCSVVRSKPLELSVGFSFGGDGAQSMSFVFYIHLDAVSKNFTLADLTRDFSKTLEKVRTVDNYSANTILLSARPSSWLDLYYGRYRACKANREKFSYEGKGSYIAELTREFHEKNVISLKEVPWFVPVCERGVLDKTVHPFDRVNTAKDIETATNALVAANSEVTKSDEMGSLLQRIKDAERERDTVLVENARLRRDKEKLERQLKVKR